MAVFKIFINTNYLPNVNDMTLFQSGRLKIIPFNRHFEEGEQDQGLKGQFAQPENLSGIFNWCLEGYRKYCQQGLETPDNASSKKINVGDSVVVFDVPQGTSYYSTLTKYQNNADWDRTVTGRKKLESGNIQIEFSGNPIVSMKDTTLIMHLPNRNGKTDHLNSATGQKINSLSGNLSFRYRYIENLWGSVCVMLDDVIIKNGEIHIIGLGDTPEVVLSYKLAEQRGTPSEGVSPAVASIQSMGYDPNNPLLMLPDSVGNGASSVSAYCDACFYQINDKDLILTYGLTWDLRQYAGLFGYRANISADESKECFMPLKIDDLLRIPQSDMDKVKIKFNQPSPEEDPLDLYRKNPDIVNTQWLFWREQKRYFYEGQIAVCFLKIGWDKWLLTTIKKITKDLNILGGISYDGDELPEYKPYYGRLIIQFHKTCQAQGIYYKNVCDELLVKNRMKDVVALLNELHIF